MNAFMLLLVWLVSRCSQPMVYGPTENMAHTITDDGAERRKKKTRENIGMGIISRQRRPRPSVITAALATDKKKTKKR